MSDPRARTADDVIAEMRKHSATDTNVGSDVALLLAHIDDLHAERDALRTGLEEAANALEAVAERTWDKRQHDECRAACADASETAGGAHEDARAVLRGPALAAGEAEGK